MAQTNLVSISITPADKDAIMQHLNSIRTILTPYLHPLTEDQREALPKMGDKTLPFVQKALEYSGTNPEFVPAAVDKIEWQKDFSSWEDLMTIKNQFAQLLLDVKDTTMVLGSEAYAPARFYNDQVKLGVKQGVPSAAAIADNLAKRYAYSRKADKPSNN